MKNYRVGIILGIISILCALTFVGIPVGFNNIVEIICTVFFALGLLAILCMGFAVKNEKISVIASAAYVVILFVLVAVVELNYNDFTLLAIGFVPGLLISGMGVIKTVKVKSDKKTTASLVLNIIGLVSAIASAALVISNGGFIIQQI